MRIDILVLPMVAAMLLAGCSFPSPPPTNMAPIADIPASAAGPIGPLNGKTVGVLFDDDTATDLDYLRRYHQHAVSSLEGRLLISEIRQGYAESSRPDRTLAAIKDAFSSRLKQVTFYGDLCSLEQGDPDIFVVVHTHHALLTPRSSDVRVDYVADFFDRDYQYLGRAQGHRAAMMPALWSDHQRTEQIVGELDRQQVVQGEALDQFGNSLSRLLQ